MTVSNEPIRQTYNAPIEVTDPVTLPFTFKNNTEVKAFSITSQTINGVTEDVNTDLFYNTDFTIVGGNLFLLNRLASGTLTVYRVTENTQASKYSSTGKFPALSHEAALDKLTRIAQELSDALARTIQLPLSLKTTFNTKIPLPIAGRALVINSDADGFNLSAVNMDDVYEALGQAQTAVDAAEAIAGNIPSNFQKGGYFLREKEDTSGLEFYDVSKDIDDTAATAAANLSEHNTNTTMHANSFKRFKGGLPQYCVNSGNVDAYGAGNIIKNIQGVPTNFTVTIASPGVFTKQDHGLLDGQRLHLITTGALPTGLATNTNYYVKKIDKDTFTLSATSGGADINTSGSQSGPHSYQLRYDDRVSFAIGTTEEVASPFFGYVVPVNNPFYYNKVYQFNGTSQYLTVPKIITLGANPWEMIFKVKFNDTTTAMTIASGGANYTFQLARTAANKIQLLVSSNGSSWDVVDGSTAGVGLGTKTDWAANTYYWFKLSFTGTAYTVNWSTDGSIYQVTPELTKASASTVYTPITKLYLGSTYAPDQYLAGSVDMSGTKITVNSSLLFNGNDTYTAPNPVCTFSNGHSYEISQMADVTGISSDATYDFILEERNLVAKADGTHLAVMNAVKLGYSFTGMLPAMTGATSEYSVTYNGVIGSSAYNLLNGQNTGMVFGSYDALGSANYLDMNGPYTVISTNYSANTITFSGDLRGDFYGATFVRLDTSKNLNYHTDGNSYGFGSVTYDSGSNTTTITLTSYTYSTYDGNINATFRHTAALPANYTTDAKFLSKTMFTVGSSNYTISATNTGLAKKLYINNITSLAGGESEGIDRYPTAYVSLSSDGGLTWSNHSATTLSYGMNIININANYNKMKLNITSMHDHYYVDGGQYWWNHSREYLYLLSINLDTEVSLAGGNITEDYGYNVASQMKNIGADGDYLINTTVSHNPAKKRVSGSYESRPFIRFGVATKTSGVLGTPSTNAFNGYFITEFTCPNTNTRTTKVHNIGTDRIEVLAYAVCTSAENGYSVGDVARIIKSADTGYASPLNWDKRNVSYNNASAQPQIPNKGTPGSTVAITQSKWNIRLIGKRGVV